MQNEFSLGILSIATNGYNHYWENLVDSASRNLNNKSSVTFHLFTDDCESSMEFSKKYSEFSYKFYEIKNLKWPEATLHRYRIYSEHAEHLAESHLMHLDSDMLIYEDFLDLVFCDPTENEMRLVLHPGFYRIKGTGIIKFYAMNPSQLIKDTKMIIRIGGIGAWEGRRQSRAYVPRSERKFYFCGGVWFGARDSFIRMVQDLEISERADSKSGITALWHDESHLNKWAISHKHRSYPPSLCFDARYKNLAGLKNIITAVDKGISSR
jgi:hypothetical protein